MTAHLDAGTLQVGNSLGHAVLQLVLDSRRAEQVQVPLELVRDALNLLLAVVDERRRLVEAPLPLLVRRLVERFPRQTQRPQPLVRKVLEVLVGLALQLLVAVAEALEDDVVGTLGEEQELVVALALGQLADDD